MASKKKAPSEGQIAAALRGTGPFGPMSRWLYRNRALLQSLWDMVVNARDLGDVDDDTHHRAAVDYQQALKNRDPDLFEKLVLFLQTLNTNPVFSWIMKSFGQFASTGLKVYRPNDVMAEMLSQTDMTVLSEDVRLPFSCIALTVPKDLQAIAPIVTSDDAKEAYNMVPEAKRIEYQFPTPERFADLHANYIVVFEEPELGTITRSITIGLLPKEFFETDFEVVTGQAYYEGQTEKEVALRTVLMHSPCPLIGVRIPMIKGKTVEECFDAAKAANKDRDLIIKISDMEEDGLHTLFRLGLNAVMALSFADSKEVAEETPKVVRKADHKTQRAVSKSIATEIRLDQTMLLGPGYAHGESDESDSPSDEKREMKPHWRRGHWRRFAVGEGRKDRIWKFVPPIFVNRHRLLEAGFDLSDTIVEVKKRSE